MECGMVGEDYKIQYFHPWHQRPPSWNGRAKTQRESGLTFSAPVSDISVPAYTIGL